MRKDYALTPTSRDGKPRRPIDVEMTPMIDVIFLLLIFFVATSSFQLVEQLMPSSVSETSESKGNSDQPPPEPTEDALEQIQIKIEMRGDKVIAVLNESGAIPLAALRERIRVIGSLGGDTPVIIDPDEDVQAEYVVQAYDWAREAGLLRVYLAIHK